MYSNITNTCFSLFMRCMNKNRIDKINDFIRMACLLWAISGMGTGILDTAHAAQALGYTRVGRTDSVMMLGTRHGGTFAVSLLTIAAMAVAVSPATQYIGLGVLLMAVPLICNRQIPDLSVRQAPVGRSKTNTTTELARLIALGMVAAAAVIPTATVYVWAGPTLCELQVPPQVSGIATTAFIIAQMAACSAYWRRSANMPTLTLIQWGLAVTAIGVLLLVPIAMQAHHLTLGPAVSTLLAVAGLILIGAGIAPLPVLTHQAVARVAPHLSLTARVAATVGVQQAAY